MQYHNITILKVRPSISKVGKVPDGAGWVIGAAARAQAADLKAAGPAGSAPGPANTLVSLAECKQDTNDTMKSYLTDIIWIITRSLVLQ